LISARSAAQVEVTNRKAMAPLSDPRTKRFESMEAHFAFMSVAAPATYESELKKG
jgi:hypothetical protein